MIPSVTVPKLIVIKFYPLKWIILRTFGDKYGLGGIAQLGERLNGIQEVSGSIPLISTKNRDSCSRKVHESLFYYHRNLSGYLIQSCEDALFQVEAITVRLNPAALNEYSLAQMGNCRDCYDSYAKWNAYQEKKKLQMDGWKQKVLSAMGLDNDLKGITIRHDILIGGKSSAHFEKSPK